MLITAGLVVAISAATGGIVHAAGGSTMAGTATPAPTQQPIGAAATTPSPTSVNDKALQSAKTASTVSTGSSTASLHAGGLFADPRAAALIASNLGVSTAAAAQALAGLIPLSAHKGGLDPRSDGFAAIATELGVSPQRLAQAIDALKRALA
jgi:hypothetical protein